MKGSVLRQSRTYLKSRKERRHWLLYKISILRRGLKIWTIWGGILSKTSKKSFWLLNISMKRFAPLFRSTLKKIDKNSFEFSMVFILKCTGCNKYNLSYTVKLEKRFFSITPQNGMNEIKRNSNKKNLLHISWNLSTSSRLSFKVNHTMSSSKAKTKRKMIDWYKDLIQTIIFLDFVGKVFLAKSFTHKII